MPVETYGPYLDQEFGKPSQRIEMFAQALPAIGAANFTASVTVTDSSGATVTSPGQQITVSPIPAPPATPGTLPPPPDALNFPSGWDSQIAFDAAAFKAANGRGWNEDEFIAEVQRVLGNIGSIFLPVSDNLLIASTYDATSFQGWSPSPTTNEGIVPASNGFVGPVLAWYLANSGDHDFADTGAQTQPFLLGHNYFISGIYRSDKPFSLSDRDIVMAELDANPGNALSFARLYRKTIDEQAMFGFSPAYQLLVISSPAYAPVGIEIKHLKIQEVAPNDLAANIALYVWEQSVAYGGVVPHNTQIGWFYDAWLLLVIEPYKTPAIQTPPAGWSSRSDWVQALAADAAAFRNANGRGFSQVDFETEVVSLLGIDPTWARNIADYVWNMSIAYAAIYGTDVPVAAQVRWFYYAWNLWRTTGAVTITASQTNLVGRGTVVFTANVNSILPITNYHWVFGDGTTADTSGPTVSHTFNLY